MKRTTILSILNILALAAMIIINGLANSLPLNNLTTGEISDRFEVYFVPAGYVFSIWGVIYIGLALFVIYQALPAQREDQHISRIGLLFIISSIANIAWLFLWHYERFSWTLLLMLSLLASLIAIYLRLDIGRATVSRLERWFVDIPFSIYLGWITVATVANATSLLDYLRWGGWGISDQAWAAIMLIIGAGLATAMIYTRNDIAYALVIIWAFVGIALKHSATASVSNTAWIAASWVGLALIVSLIFPFHKKRKT